MNTKDQVLKVRTWVEIDMAAMRHNYDIFRGIIASSVKLMAVVKSNAYGNELVGFSKTVDEFGVDFFGVDSITEAMTLREKGITKPILVLGYTLPENLVFASENNISVTLSSFDMLETMIHTKIPLKVHVKIDTGMHRQGFFVEDMKKLVGILLKNSHIEVEGIFTHFANAKNPKEPKDTDNQAKEFEKAVAVFSKNEFVFLKHASATSGAILFPQYQYDMVRIGIGLHGLWPSKEVQKAFEKKLFLKPILTWKSLVSETKMVKAGEGVGYDFTERLKKDTKLAIIPIGYWHGYPRLLSSVGYVLVRGVRARVVGRVAMDMLVVDVSDSKGVIAGDEVVLIGKQKKGEVTASEIGILSKTSQYEIVTRLNPKMRRLFI